MRLTEAGRLLLSYAERIFGLEQAAERAMRELADLECGELAIGASNTLGTYLLPGLLASFHSRYPKIGLSLEIGNTQEIAKGILDSRFALGFGSSEAVKRAALEGVAAGWISEVCVTEELRTGRLVALRIPRLSLERPLYWLSLRGRHLNRSALMFLERLER